MSDWLYVEKDPAEALARLHFFSVKKKHPAGEVDVLITVREFATPEIGALRFVALADLELNQQTAKFQPAGYGSSLMEALSECLKIIRSFEYEG